MSTIATPLKLPSFLQREPGAALVGRREDTVVARVDGPAAGEQGVSLGLSAVIGEWAEFRINRIRARADDVEDTPPLPVQGRIPVDTPGQRR